MKSVLTRQAPLATVWSSVVAVLTVLGVTAVLLAIAPGPARADLSAAAVIQQWSNQLAAGPLYKPAVITLTQGGGPYSGNPGSAYIDTILVRAANGSLTANWSPIYFSDRKASIPGRPIQPFDSTRTDRSDFTLTLSGQLIEHSITWGFTQTIDLTALGNNMLAGWGGSIGNTGAPSYWVIAVTPQAYPIPG